MYRFENINQLTDKNMDQFAYKCTQWVTVEDSDIHIFTLLITTVINFKNFYVILRQY